MSTMFGMLMAVAREIPSLEQSAEFRTARNSTMLADNGAPVARLTGNENRILIDPERDLAEHQERGRSPSRTAASTSTTAWT